MSLKPRKGVILCSQVPEPSLNDLAGASVVLPGELHESTSHGIVLEGCRWRATTTAAASPGLGDRRSSPELLS